MKSRVGKVKKAAPKKGRKGRRRKKKEAVVVDAAFLASVPMFAGLDEALRGRLATRIEHLDVERGDNLLEGQLPEDDDSSVLVILFGDVSVHRTTTKEEIVNYLTVGEPFVQKLFKNPQTTQLRVTAMCPVRALKLNYRDVNYALKKEPIFRAAFTESIRGIGTRQATRFDNEFQREIAQFLVAERLTFAGRVKIKRMDICIECDGCYTACKSRHGTDRLGASEVKYGLTEIPQNCHNCVVPECVDKCKFGHISRDPATGEITIADDCTGCTMCSRGCSFDSIRMHSLADLDVAKYFPNRSPDAKGKSIAQKCDNCVGYSDKACISACPTGALFQVDGADLFEYWEQFNVHQRPGFDEVASPERRKSWTRRIWIALTILNVLVLTWESLGRLFWLDMTFGSLFYEWGLTAGAINPEAPFRAGDFFSHAMGYIGGGCLLGTQFYRIGKAFAPRLGSIQAWMESHIWLGIIGGVHGFYHAAFVFHEAIAVFTFITMALAIGTGIIGRYLLFLVPRSQAGQQLALGEINEKIQQINQTIEESFVDRRVSYTMMTRLEKLGEENISQAIRISGESTKDEEEAGLITGMMRLIGRDRRHQKAVDAMGAELEGKVAAGKKEEVLVLLKDKIRMEQSVKRHAFLARVLKRYRVVHVVSSNIMFGALALHVITALMYSVGN